MRHRFVKAAVAALLAFSFLPTQAWAGSYGFPSKAEDAAHSSADTGMPAWGVVNIDSAARAGSDGDYSTLATTKEGGLICEPSRQMAYCASILSTTPAASTTDICELRYVSKVIRLKRVWITLSGSASTVTPTFLIKRSSQDTAGTSTDVTVCPQDSNNAAATGVLRRYTANPTTGTTLANIAFGWVTQVNSGTANPPGGGRYLLYDANGGQGIVLRTSSQSVAVNFNGTAPTGSAAVSVDMEWTEDQ